MHVYDLVTVDSKVIDGMVATWVYAFIGTLVVTIIIGLAWGITKFRTPKPANNLTKAAHRHLPLILLAGLDHFADLYPLRDFIPEVLESFPFGKGPKKRWFRFVLPQQTNISNIPVANEKNEQVTLKVIKALNDLNTEKTVLRGVNSPIFVGVKNRAIAASMPFLGALNWMKDLEYIGQSSVAINALKTSQHSQFRELGELLGRMATGVSLIDFHAVYKNVDVNWDHTIQDSISERDKTDGRLEGREDKEKQTKTVLLLILGIAAFFCIAIIASKVL